MTKFRQVSVENIAEEQINPATTEEQEALQGLVGEVQLTPSNYTLLKRLKDIVDKLADIFGDSVGGQVIIKDGAGNDYFVSVTPTGRLLVSTETPDAPEDTIAFNVTLYDEVSGTEDEYWVIPDGQEVILQRFSAGSEQDTSFGSAGELWYDPDGDLGVNMTIIDVIFCNGTSNQHDLNEILIGDGIGRLVLRRRRFSGGTKEVFVRLEGYYGIASFTNNLISTVTVTS